MDKKQIFAILMVVLMFMGVFVVLSSLTSPDNPSQNSPALSSTSELLKFIYTVPTVAKKSGLEPSPALYVGRGKITPNPPINVSAQ